MHVMLDMHHPHPLGRGPAGADASWAGGAGVDLSRRANPVRGRSPSPPARAGKSRAGAARPLAARALTRYFSRNQKILDVRPELRRHPELLAQHQPPLAHLELELVVARVVR